MKSLYKQGVDILGESVFVGAFDIQAEQRRMNGLKNVSVDQARALLKGGQIAIDQARKIIKDKNLPNKTPAENVYYKLQWHADALKRAGAPTSLYGSSEDLKTWAMRAFIEEDAAEFGAGMADANWNALWSDMGDRALAAAMIPAAAAQTAANTVKTLTTIPPWAWILGGTAVTGLVGFGLYKIVLATAPAAASAYLGGRR